MSWLKGQALAYTLLSFRMARQENELYQHNYSSTKLVWIEVCAATRMRMHRPLHPCIFHPSWCSTNLICIVFTADCSLVVPACKYRLNGTVYDVTGPLPCELNRVWTFVRGNNLPTVNGQVTCIVPKNPFNGSLVVSSFSATSKTCATATAKVNVTVTPFTGYNCPTSLTVGAFVGR